LLEVLEDYFTSSTGPESEDESFIDEDDEVMLQGLYRK